MKVIKNGYIYELRNYDDKGSSQTISFINKHKSTDSNVYSTSTEDGTTTEEVISMLIHRLKYVNTLKPSSFNKLAIKHLNESLAAINMRKQSKIETHLDYEDKQLLQ